MAKSMMKGMAGGAGSPTTKTGKTAVRSTMTPVFGKSAKRAGAKRSGRSR